MYCERGQTPQKEGLKSKIEGSLERQETIRIKLSGDGTNRIGKRLKVNFTHTILNEKENDMRKRATMCLGLSNQQRLVTKRESGRY